MGAKSSRNTSQNNRSDGHLLPYLRNTFVRGGGASNVAALRGLTATGGSISDYVDPTPGIKYRVHVFTSLDTFDVAALGDYGNTVEYLVVAGGGGGRFGESGGAGAGGYRTSVVGDSSGGGNSAESVIPVSVRSYSIVIGAGGAVNNNGTDSHFGPGSPTPIPATGGGYGASYNGTGGSGGSGGGTGDYPRGGRIGTANGYPGPTAQGYPGGQGASDQSTYTMGGGGGGAGAAGAGYPTGPNPRASVPSGGAGGNGIRTSITGPSYSIGTPGPASSGGTGGGSSTAVTGGWLAGGGGGCSASSSPAAIGGAGGGGTSGVEGTSAASNGSPSTGGGGGSGGPGGGSGGSGIIAVRYRIGPTQS